jgi:dolichyl-phosphate-mannose--protein O-mannosyl transferase
MDWVQLETLFIWGLVLGSTIYTLWQEPEKEGNWLLVGIVILIMIPFARVLKLL